MKKNLLAQTIHTFAQPNKIFVATLAIAATQVMAEENADKKNADHNDNVVTVIGIKQSLTTNVAQSTMRTEADLSTVPRSAVVLNDELIDKQNAQDLSDALANISNVTENNSYGGTRDQFSIRGFDANVYEDGTRIYGLGQDKSVLEDAEYIEVVKGPESVLYGNMNPGGLINMIGKIPEAERRTEVTLQDINGQRRISADTTGSLDKNDTLLYRLVGVVDDSESWRDHAKTEQIFLAPSLTWNATDSTSITLSYKYNKENIPFDRGTLAVRNADNTGWEFLDIGSKRLGADFSTQERETQKLSLNIEQDVTDFWTTRLKLQHQKREYDGTLVHFYAASAVTDPNTGTIIYNQDQYKAGFDGTINRYILGKDTSSTTDVISWENQFEFDIFSTDHQLIAGIDATRHKDDTTTSVSKTWSGQTAALPIYSNIILGTADPNAGAYNYYSDDFTHTINPEDMFDLQDEHTELEEYGVYMNDLIEIGDWHFAAGVRVDRYRRKYQRTYDKTFAAGVANLGIDLENDDTKSPFETNTSGQLGALYEISDALSVYSNIATSYLPNDSYDSVAKEWVDAQEGTQYEIGTKLSLLDSKLNVTLAGFRIDLKNVAYAIGSTGGYDIYKQRSQGFEIDGDYAMTDNLTTLFSYGYTDATFTDSPDTVYKPVNIPEHNANVWVFYDVNKEWGLGSGVIYVGERAGNRRINYDYKLDAYTLVNATAWYQPNFANHQLKFQVSVENLFDEDYYTASSDSTQNAVYLGTPRTIALKANYKF